MSTILVVEDSKFQRKMLTQLLGDNQFTVTSARDGVEALEQVKSTCPDLVVLDIIMPRVNGYEVCRRLKSNPQTKNVPIVFCSSQAGHADRYWGMKNGADAYIGKPFQAGELLATVRQLLRV